VNLNAVVEQLKLDEGFSAKSYFDNDQWTWGYGTKAPGPEARITRANAEVALVARTQAAIADFADVFAGVEMSEVRQHAFVNMLFNLGETKLRKFKKMLAAVRAGDWEGAAAQATSSLWYRQLSKPDNGQEERAERIVREIKEG